MRQKDHRRGARGRFGIALAIITIAAACVAAADGGRKSGGSPVKKDPMGVFRFSDTGNMGDVLFDHFAHQSRQPDCRNCHEGLFPMKRGMSDAKGKFNTESMLKGEYCGRCHDGAAAFPVKGECAACHLPEDGK